MDTINVRKACYSDKMIISILLADALKKYSTAISETIYTFAKALEKNINLDLYNIVEYKNEIIGVIAISNNNVFSIKTDLHTYIKYFGLVKEIIAKVMLFPNLDRKKKINKTTAYIDFLIIKEDYRKKHVVKIIMDYIAFTYNYSDYLLDVSNVHKDIIELYKSCGFNLLKKQNKIDEKLLMKYTIL